MKDRRIQHRASSGFTLIEVIMVLLILGVAGATISALQDKLFAHESTLEGMQVRTSLMTECMEKILAVRRFPTEDGYNAVTTATCANLPALGSYAVPAVTITTPYIGTACPTNFTCKTATVSQAGMTPLTVMLVTY